MIGQLLDGRYRVVQILSAGAFGQTYLAADTRRPGHPQCVVKQLRAPGNSYTIVRTAHRLFKQEAEILEKLGRHEQIPLLLAYFEENNQFYLVEEFIPGKPLNKEIIPGKPWQEKQVIKLLLEILEILVFVHENGVIHRDVNPSNLIRHQTNKKLVLIDFGSVKEVSHKIAAENGEVQRTIATGTPSYMPIEQFQGIPQFNSDLYAVGMIGIQALTGIPGSELPKLQDLRPSNPSGILWRNRTLCSSNLANIVDRMVHYHYTKRYQSVEEVVKALQKISSRPQKLTKQLPKTKNNRNYQTKTSSRRVKSHPLWFVLFGFASVGVIAVLIGLVYFLNRPNPVKAERIFEKGIENANNGNQQAAIAAYDKAIQLNPNEEEYYYKRGNAYYNLENYQKAIANYSKVINLNPSHVNAHFNRGTARYDTQDYAGAINDFTQVLRLKPQDAEAFYKRGLVHYSSQNYPAAIQDHTQAIRLQPNNIDAYHGRGLARAANNDLQGAITDYTEMVRLEPQKIDGYYSRGRARFFMGDYQGSLDDYNKVIEIDPENEEAYANRCSTYLNLATYEKAISDCTKAITINPENEVAYNNRCIAYLNIKEYEKSISDCTKTIEIAPKSPSAYTNRGLAYASANQLEKAIEDYTQAIAISPNNAEAYANRASVYSEQENYEQAIADYVQAIRLNPEYADAYYSRGLVRVNLGDRKGAISDFEKAAKLYLEQGRTGGYRDAQYQIEQLN
ncbi:MAG: tetratricopeptide repeat protein [Okeania sp. SIO2C2]|uniref:Serine/threonine-protein kinase n=2 Tax=Microcoleaceae TaxID=1892252 RepID=A0A3N6PIV1_9CYAN|nr:serine/threonine-protein kinase [Okeania sp. SIO1H5]NEP89685.1 tetratricopeptide repeat protein [Okeania sp. SIO2C2]NES76274.1 tetratricopeptide repeat protein [Okeania sp. SIO1H4]NES88323.1 tetratricopeptide repeat protein [Okeania sp. SIO2B9]NET12998.1 tetratricopeptide repeat protein [Okeania sp. SIO1H6]NET74604.1 tetratricopeptide repeat protein [Okeania sp. SIO1F9]NET93644.1 tetratricopeptide repeat protein [Okeania sp. SIO1H2]RQH06222.1 serine/threonine-protein kinase [Okeania hirsu